jgi:tRNA pseudouridine32 synthase/23S rRNA pseudouridine746 synthase
VLPPSIYKQPVYDRPFTYAPPQSPLSIISEALDYLIIDKPAGLLSVPGKNHPDCMEARVKIYCPEALTIHRLDMATSGLMVFAKHKAAQRHLGLQFEKRQTQKTYIADVAGRLNSQSGRVNLPIWTDWVNRPKQMIDFIKGRHAVTDWVVDSRNKDRTRLNLYPVTGRSHQLRLHAVCLGHAIIGDRLYASDEDFQAGSRLHLHAAELSFREPTGGVWVHFNSPCPF